MEAEVVAPEVSVLEAGVLAVHVVVATCSAVPAAEAASSWRCWSATSVAWSLVTSALVPLPPDVPVEGTVVAVSLPPPDPPEDPVPVDVPVPVEDVDVVAASAWVVSSEARVAWADARLASAVTTADCSDVGSSVATTWPAVTCWPTVTLTVPTVPGAVKVRFACWTGVMVPTVDSVATADPVSTWAVR